MSTRSSLAEDVIASHPLTTLIFSPSLPANGRYSPTHGPMRVYIRLVFIRIGEIDTLNEKYEAQLTMESRWPVDLPWLSSFISSNEQKRLVEGKSIALVKYGEDHWHPQLYIENALGDLKEQIRYTAKKSKDDQQIYICEHRDVKGVFWEKLELQHFPSDVQELSISIGSMLYNDKVLLVNDPHHLSGVNQEAFVDQQEWSLYRHVVAEEGFAKEFLFRRAINEEDDDDENHPSDSEDRQRSVLIVTCHAARQSNYFYWNGYCLIFLITLLSFCLFGIPPYLAPSRIQASCTLLLTSITFRWTVNRSLPTISYLTSMDKYAIMCIFILIILCLWHTGMSALVFAWTTDSRVTPEMWLARLDRYVFFFALTAFVIIHLILLACLYFYSLKHRREMLSDQMAYHLALSEHRDPNIILLSRKKSRLKRASPYSRIRPEK